MSPVCSEELPTQRIGESSGSRTLLSKKRQLRRDASSRPPNDGDACGNTITRNVSLACWFVRLLVRDGGCWLGCSLSSSFSRLSRAELFERRSQHSTNQTVESLLARPICEA